MQTLTRSFMIVAALVVPAGAFAQQQPTTPSQIALQIDAVVNQWAQALESAQQTMRADQAKIADLQKQVDALKTKSEPKEPDSKPKPE